MVVMIYVRTVEIITSMDLCTNLQESDEYLAKVVPMSLRSILFVGKTAILDIEAGGI